MSNYVKFAVIILIFFTLIGCSKPDPATLLQKGNEALKAEDFDEAIDNFTKVIEADSQMFEAYLGRAEALLRKAKPEESLEDCKTALELKPDNEQALLIKADATANTLAIEEAIQLYGYIIEKYPESAKAYMMRGNLHINGGDFREGFTDFDSALEINPQYSEVYLTRGVTHFQNGEYEKAIREYSLAIEHKDAGFFESPPTYAYYNRGHAYRKIGKIEEALADWKTVYELSPDSQEGKMVKDQLKDMGVEM
jgi:tetratricopeptide (TPR) repeat protein